MEVTDAANTSQNQTIFHERVLVNAMTPFAAQIGQVAICSQAGSDG